MKSDYLKYWRVVRYFIKAKYGLNAQELDMLLFLRSEQYFDKGRFQDFNNLLGWNKNRFEKFLRERIPPFGRQPVSCVGNDSIGSGKRNLARTGHIVDSRL